MDGGMDGQMDGRTDRHVDIYTLEPWLADLQAVQICLPTTDEL